MPVSRIARVAVAVTALCALPSLVLAQAKPFEPTVGQAGKDVVWVPTPDSVVTKMADLRTLGDKLETMVADDLWPLPSYREMLFIK